MEVILLGIYSFFVWFIFFKKKWLPWNITSQVIVVTIPIIGIAILTILVQCLATGRLIARFGADHVLLGTDYPYDMGMERPVEFIEGVQGLSKAQTAAIEGMNAARLLKIDYNAAQRRRS